MAKKKKKKKPKARTDEEFGAMVEDAESMPAEGMSLLLTHNAPGTSPVCHDEFAVVPALPRVLSSHDQPCRSAVHCRVTKDISLTTSDGDHAHMSTTGGCMVTDALWGAQAQRRRMRRTGWTTSPSCHGTALTGITHTRSC